MLGDVIAVEARAVIGLGDGEPVGVELAERHARVVDVVEDAEFHLYASHRARNDVMPGLDPGIHEACRHHKPYGLDLWSVIMRAGGRSRCKACPAMRSREQAGAIPLAIVAAAVIAGSSFESKFSSKPAYAAYLMRDKRPAYFHSILVIS